MLIVLKGVDEVSKHSDRVAKNMAIARCMIKQKNYLKATMGIDPRLASFCDKKVLHVSDIWVRDLFCKSLPSLVVSETESVLRTTSSSGWQRIPYRTLLYPNLHSLLYSVNICLIYQSNEKPSRKTLLR